MQRDIRGDDYEIIIIDNGSTKPFDPKECLEWGAQVHIHYMSEPSVSPVAAINYGIGLARGHLIGVLIDGARMVSPGLLSTALDACKLHERPVIGTLGFHLGPDVQMRSIHQGYNQAREDALLASVNWTENGYALFDIAVFAGSSAEGWFGGMPESTCLFLSKSHWHELGGFDPGFRQSGGGLVNLDMWERAVSTPNSQVVLLLGEATFHQIHGGISTNAVKSPWQMFHEEYVQLRGRPYTEPAISPIFVGKIHDPVLTSLMWSAQARMNKANSDKQRPTTLRQAVTRIANYWRK
jgi:hypothetical protein